MIIITFNFTYLTNNMIHLFNIVSVCTYIVYTRLISNYVFDFLTTFYLLELFIFLKCRSMLFLLCLV